MGCECGTVVFTYIASGGMQCGGSATINPDLIRSTGQGAACGGCAFVSVPTQVFGDYSGCWHLVEHSTGTNGEYKDSSGHNNATGEITTLAGNYPVQTLSTLYAYCQDMEDVDWIQAPIDSCPNNGPLSVSLWMQPTGLYLPQRVVFSRGEDNAETGQGCSIALGYTVGGNTFANVQVVGEDGWNLYTLTGATELTLGCWYHVALVFVPGVSLTLYVDGNVDSETSIVETQLVPSTTFNQFGRQDNAQPYDGLLQEVRILPKALTQSWIQTEHDNLCTVGWTSSGEETPVWGP
jgi:hypothetical protein